jgi:4'-phosphopantetheinyl transferase
MDVHWLEQTSADLPAGDDWLSAGEAARLAGMRFAKRRADWRLGRWTAKRAASLYLSLPADSPSLARIQIRPAPSGAPEVFLGDEPAPVTISISHREGRAACAIAGPDVTLGCDLEVVEPRGEAFAGDYFAAAEQELFGQAFPAARWRLLALLWSGKESVLKALRTGLRLDTRSVTIYPIDALLPAGGNSWRPLHAHYEDQDFEGWWQQTGRFVRTMVASPAPARPHILEM